MTTTFRFGAAARLKGGAEFRRVFHQGSKAVGRSLILWQRVDQARKGPRLGLSVSSKAGGSVRRSRLKRLIRETFRLRRAELAPGLDLIVYPRPGCDWKSRADAERAILDQLRKPGRMKAR